MEREKLIRLAKFIGIILLIVIIVENSIKGIGNALEKKKIKDKEEEKIQNYQNSDEYKETVMLESVISDFVEVLNSNDIEKLYNLIDLNYKEYKFQNDIEKFKEHISTYVNKDSKISLQSYNLVNGGYLCRLLSENDENLKTFMVLIDKKESTEEYSIIFDNITEIKKIDNSQNIDGLECNILYNITLDKTLVYAMEFTNTTSQNIAYTYLNAELRDTDYNIFRSNTKEFKINLKPGESIRKDIVFYNEQIHMLPKRFYIINFKNQSNLEKNLTIYVGE